jgi:hypothetical protein
MIDEPARLRLLWTRKRGTWHARAWPGKAKGRARGLAWRGALRRGHGKAWREVGQARAAWRLAESEPLSACIMSLLASFAAISGVTRSRTAATVITARPSCRVACFTGTELRRLAPATCCSPVYQVLRAVLLTSLACAEEDRRGTAESNLRRVHYCTLPVQSRRSRRSKADSLLMAGASNRLLLATLPRSRARAEN